MRALRRIARFGLIALTLALPRSAPAQDATSESELLRAHIEQLHDSPEVLVRGVPIASRRTLPSLIRIRRRATTAGVQPAPPRDPGSGAGRRL